MSDNHYSGEWISPEIKVPDHDDDVLIHPESIWGPTAKHSRMRGWHIWSDTNKYVSLETPKYWTELPIGPDE